MLPTLIQKYDEIHFIFDPVQNRETNRNFYRLSDATLLGYRINTIYQFIKHFLDKIMSIFKEYGAFNTSKIL